MLKNPDIVKGFVAATVKTVDMLNDPDAGIALLKNRTVNDKN